MSLESSNAFLHVGVVLFTNNLASLEGNTFGRFKFGTLFRKHLVRFRVRFKECVLRITELFSKWLEAFVGE